MPAKPAAKPRKAKAPSRVKNHREVRFVTSDYADVTYALSDDGDFFRASKNAEGKLEIVAPCGEAYSFIIADILEVLKLV